MSLRADRVWYSLLVRHLYLRLLRSPTFQQVQKAPYSQHLLDFLCMALTAPEKMLGSHFLPLPLRLG